ncbi:unnamed protein product [Calypogeia fissa]
MDFQLAEVFRLAASLCESENVDASSAEVVVEDAIASRLEESNVPHVDVDDISEPWHAAAAKLSQLSARPAVERAMMRPNIVMLDNRDRIFSLVGPVGKVYYPQRVLLDSGAQPLMIGRAAFAGLGLKASNIDKCPFQLQTFVGSVESTQWLTKGPLGVTFLPNHPSDASMMKVQTVVTRAESYDVLVGSTVLYPMGFILDYWAERVSFRPGWQSGDGRIAHLPATFFFNIKPRPKDGVSTLAAFAAMSDIMWRGDLLEGNSSAVDVLVMEERPAMYPEQGIRLLDLFGGINTGLVAVLQAGIKVHQYLYVERNEAARRASIRHVARLMEQYPDLLPMSGVRAYQH